MVLPSISARSATLKAPTRAAPDEIPQGIPSVSAAFRRGACQLPSSTSAIRSGWLGTTQMNSKGSGPKDS